MAGVEKSRSGIFTINYLARPSFNDLYNGLRIAYVSGLLRYPTKAPIKQRVCRSLNALNVCAISKMEFHLKAAKFPADCERLEKGKTDRNEFLPRDTAYIHART
jgi:hypothetical protein